MQLLELCAGRSHADLPRARGQGPRSTGASSSIRCARFMIARIELARALGNKYPQVLSQFERYDLDCPVARIVCDLKSQFGAHLKHHEVFLQNLALDLR